MWRGAAMLRLFLRKLSEIKTNIECWDFERRGRINRTLLHAAVENRDIELVKKLKHLVNKRNGNGWTPLLLAANLGYSDMVETLLGIGADRHVKDNHGHSPMEMAKDGMEMEQMERDLHELEQDIREGNKAFSGNLIGILSSLEDHCQKFSGNDISGASDRDVPRGLVKIGKELDSIERQMRSNIEKTIVPFYGDTQDESYESSSFRKGVSDFSGTISLLS
jgi:hypothetical protein